MIDPNAPAYPQHGWSSDPETIERMSTQGGLTKREYFAAMAMQGLMDYEETGTVKDAEIELGIPNGTYRYQIHWPKILAIRACTYADALIAELNKEPSK